MKDLCIACPLCGKTLWYEEFEYRSYSRTKLGVRRVNHPSTGCELDTHRAVGGVGPEVLREMDELRGARVRELLGIM